MTRTRTLIVIAVSCFLAVMFGIHAWAAEPLVKRSVVYGPQAVPESDPINPSTCTQCLKQDLVDFLGLTDPPPDPEIVCCNDTNPDTPIDTLNLNEEAYFCSGPPLPFGNPPLNCYRFISGSELVIHTNPWINLGGRYIWSPY